MPKLMVRVAFLAAGLAALARAGDLSPALVRGSAAGLVGWGEADGWPVGAGDAYKIGFTPGAAELVPALGDGWPHNLPLRLELLDASRGAEWAFTADGRALPVVDGAAVRFEHSAGLTERWELRADGAELSFVLDEVPAGAGDLVLRMRVTTELRAQTAAANGADALRFLAGPEGTPPAGVRVGRAEGVDASGARVPGGVRLVGDVLELSLPDEFLRRARAPLVLDPLVGPITNYAQGSQYQKNVGAAYDASYGRWLVIWERTYSDTDHDIHGVRVGADGGVIGSLVPIENSLEDDEWPDVATVNLRDRWLVAWWRGGSGYFARTVSPADGSVGTTGKLVTKFTNPLVPPRPTLGGNSTLVDDRCLMAWSADSQIWITSVRVPASGPPVADPAKLVDSTQYIFPHLPPSGGALNHFLLLWTKSEGLRAALYDRFGNVLVGATDIVVGTSISPALADSVDGDGQLFAVGFTQSDAVTFDTLEAHCLRVEHTGSTLTAGPDVVFPGTFWQEANVAWNGLSFQVACTPFTVPEALPPGLYIAGLAPSGFETYDPFASVGVVDNSQGVVLASPTAGTGLPAETGLAVWNEGNGATPVNLVAWQTVLSHGAGGSVVNLGGGCGAGGGQLLTLGAPALGNPNFQFIVLGANPSATVIYLNATFAATGVTCGSCVRLPLGILVALPAVGGIAVATLPLSAEPVWDGFITDVQGIVLTPGSSPCPTLPGVSFTNRVRITLH